MTDLHARGVECYSGHAYAAEPRAITWQGERHPVARVVARWRMPAGPAFRVRTATGVLFDLAYDETQDTWTVTPIREETHVIASGAQQSPSRTQSQVGRGGPEETCENS